MAEGTFDRELEGVEELRKIIQYFLVKDNTKDKWVWVGSTNGKFSVKAAYS